MDKRTILDCTGGFLIGFCILVIGAFAFTYYKSINNKVPDVNMQIVLPVDSTGILTDVSIQQAEELKAELVRHEQLLEDRYKHVLEQKENMNDLLTIGGMFLTIIISLFGFFGYKSMTTLEEKIKEEAISTAELTAEKTADGASKSKIKLLEQTMMEIMEESINKKVALAGNSSRKVLEGKLKEAMKEVRMKINDDASNLFNELTSNMDDIKKRCFDLDEKVKNLQTNSDHQLKVRRSLANGGKKQ